MLEILGTVFGSIFSGGATGIIGVVAQRFADYKNKQLDMQLEAQRQANALQMKEVDAKIMAQEATAKVEQTKVEGELRKEDDIIKGKTETDVADAAALAASYNLEPKQFSSGTLTDGQRWLMVVLDAFRGAVRPLLTIYLCMLTTLVYYQARNILSGQQLDMATAMELEKMIVGTILYLTTTCVLWWFGTRNKGTP
jgi:hypothetical protein